MAATCFHSLQHRKTRPKRPQGWKEPVSREIADQCCGNLCNANPAQPPAQPPAQTAQTSRQAELTIQKHAWGHRSLPTVQALALAACQMAGQPCEHPVNQQASPLQLEPCFVWPPACPECLE
eukprot:4297051-Amphidinium_carterae.1